jgi:hypothetical protein
MQQFPTSQQPAAADFVSAYEKAMQEVIAGCGSRQAANSMIGELQGHYERTASELKKAGGDEQARAGISRAAKIEANRIIEKYAPNTGNHFHELVISYSFGAIMLTIPMVAAASLLTVATGILAAGGAYFVSAKILRNWKGMVARRRVSDLSGVVGPKHIKGLPRILGVKEKK